MAFLSRLPLQAPVQLHPYLAGLAPVQAGDPPGDPSTPLPTRADMGRGALQVTVTADGHDLTIISAHLKSKLLTFPGGRFQPRDEGERARFGAYALYLRAAQAVTLRAHLDQVLGGHGDTVGTLPAGDLNDGVDAATTQLLHGPPGSEIGTPGFDRPDRGDPQRMWNPALRIPQAQRFTRIFRGRGELIDHIFASRFLVTKPPRSPPRWPPGSCGPSPRTRGRSSASPAPTTPPWSPASSCPASVTATRRAVTTSSSIDHIDWSTARRPRPAPPEAPWDAAARLPGRPSHRFTDSCRVSGYFSYPGCLVGTEARACPEPWST